MSELPNNLRRLLGLHALTAARASDLIGLSQQALSELQAGRRENPRRQTVEKLATFFEIQPGRLEYMSFDQLLGDELGDPVRYLKVEAKISGLAPESET
jgi:transcriptional regulator with XRE-family HTH domain